MLFCLQKTIWVPTVTIAKAAHSITKTKFVLLVILASNNGLHDSCLTSPTIVSSSNDATNYSVVVLSSGTSTSSALILLLILLLSLTG
jgi:hypothetical protein